MKLSVGLTVFACLLSATQANSEIPVTATYTVPVPQELMAYASFSIPNANVSVVNGIVELKYDLPLELVSSQIHKESVRMRGISAPFPGHFGVEQLGGTARGECLNRQDGITCLVSYRFETEVDEVLAYVKKIYPLPQISFREKVARAFGHEAGGTVHFPGKFQ